MMRVRTSTVRRRRAQSASSALQKEKDLSNKQNRNQGSKREKKKSVQWADDVDREFPKGSLRKFNSDGYLEFDKALRKLTKVSSILERSATLEKDFEEDLQNIQKKLETEVDLKVTEESQEGCIWKKSFNRTFNRIEKNTTFGRNTTIPPLFCSAWIEHKAVYKEAENANQKK